MSRAIGFHRLGDETAYALVEKLDLAPAQILAAGKVPHEKLADLIDRLDAANLPWALALEGLGRTHHALPADWPLRARGAAVLTAPASAAAFWDWEHGRFDVEDLYLWLSPQSLHWSRGLPGRDLSGSVPRTGPLRDTLRPALSRAQSNRNPVVLAMEGDAPGGEVLEDLVRQAGHELRPLQRPAEEMGADPAAAGAGLATLSESYPALRPPAKLDRSFGWRRMIGGWIWGVCVASFGWHQVQTHRADEFVVAEQEQPLIGGSWDEPAAPPPARWADLLTRRQAVLAALDPEGDVETLASLRILSDPSSAEIRVERERIDQ